MKEVLQVVTMLYWTKSEIQIVCSKTSLCIDLNVAQDPHCTQGDVAFLSSFVSELS